VLLPRLIVVSNRVAVPDPAGKASAGGLATALTEALAERGGIWFGWSGKVADEPSLEPRIVDRGRLRYALMDLSPNDHAEYYNGLANRALWPTMHYRLSLAEFSRSDYAGYRRVNGAFARVLAGLIEPGDLVWVHDYHVIPLGSELRALGVENPIGYFHHIPWPAPEVLGMLPGSRDLLSSMMDYDLVGLQTEVDVDNLRRALVWDVGASVVSASDVSEGGRRLRLRRYPVGIDPEEFRQAAERAASDPMVSETVASIGSRRLLIGVDRLDYSKGVPERMEAYERFLLSNPDLRGRVVFLQIAPQSRSEVPEYADVYRQVNETVGRINGTLGEPSWAPINLVTHPYSREVLAGLYRFAGVGLVTPMRDGMNLVAKEYVAAQDPENPGVLVLSKFAGAAEQLTDALLVNPYDKFEVAEAMREAVYMGLEERRARWEAMQRCVVESDIAWWRAAFLGDLSAVQPQARGAGVPAPVG
jgi:trehalose 6-phosphate synthase